jgi:hypothetical protein
MSTTLNIEFLSFISSKHNHVFDRLIISIASTRNRRYFENFSSEQKVDEVDFLESNLSWIWVFDLFQLIVQLQTSFVDVLCLNRSRRKHEVAINLSFLFSIDDMISVYFLFSLSMKFSMLEIESCLICSWNEHDVCRRSLIREQLQLRSCAFELV